MTTRDERAFPASVNVESGDDAKRGRFRPSAGRYLSSVGGPVATVSLRAQRLEDLGATLLVAGDRGGNLTMRSCEQT